MAVVAGPVGGMNLWRTAGWSAAAALLLLPAVAMQFTSEVNWTGSDFVVMGVLIGSVGLAIEFLVRRSASTAYRLGAVLAVVSAFLVVWVNLAVGMIGSEDNIHNLLFLGVIAIALLGAAAARFRAGGMALAMASASLAQALIGGFGMLDDMRGGLFTIAMAGLWLGAAWLFGRAARD